MPVAMAMPSVKSRTGPFSEISCARVVNCPASVTSRSIVTDASEQPDDGAGEREQRAFGQELTHEAPSAGAERHPDRHSRSRFSRRASIRLATLAHTMSRRKPGGAEQNPERRTEAARQLVAERHAPSR